MRLQARSEYFYARAVRVQLHTRAFLKFKSSCTVVVSSDASSFGLGAVLLQIQTDGFRRPVACHD